MVKGNICTWRTLVIGLTVLILLTAIAGAAPASTGNRIWDRDKGMPKTYTWNSYSFAGFYYNLDENLGTEELTIRDINRNVDEGNIIYRTSPMEVSFGYSGFGKYQVIGFMADKYFAGYTGNSVISNKDAKSVLGSGQLHKILMDDDDKRVVSEGGTLTLRDGYVLQMKEVDVGAGPGQVWVTLLKDGAVVDDDTVSGNDLYVYSKKVGSVSDMPIIAVHFDSVFRGREVNAAFIRGIFQISESFTPVETDDRYGEMEIRSVGADGIEMTNRNSIGLSAGNTIDLMGDLKIIVADSSDLRFALSVERAGIFEARGTVYTTTVQEWTPMNFGLNVGGTNIGFYYDLDQDIGTEKLKVETISGRSIPEGGLKYSTSSEEVNFDYSGFGKYQVIGFMAEKYFAGYTGNSIISNKETKSTLGSGQLHKVLLDDDAKRTVAQGGTLTLKEGYVLQMKEVDTGAGPGQVWVTLLKDGKEVDDDVVSGNDAYIYMTNAGGVKELPTIAVHFDSVFRGREVNAAFIRGVFQISESFTQARTGDRYGAMEITGVGAEGIQMMNRNSMSLSSGETADVMGNIKFKVADSSTLRFYPFVTVSPEMIANQLLIDAPARATAGDAINIKVTAGGKPVDGASVGIGSDTALTDKDGVLKYTLQKSIKGSYNITATKLGYQKTSKGIEIQAYVENKLSIDAPAKANQFETITIRVAINGTPIKDTEVMFDNATAGLTDDTGTLRYVLNDSGTHTIYASKSGYVTAARDISIAVPFAEFKALDITASDVVFTNQEAVIKSNVTNAGTKTDTLPVVLIVNSTEVESKPVTLAPKEIKEVTFKYNVALPAGNYTAEVLGQKKQIEVRESEASILSLIGIIFVLICVGGIIIYLLTKKGTGSLKIGGKTP